MNTMSPEEARLILDGAKEHGSHLSIDYQRALETIAGTREEWGVSYGGDKPQAWWPSREAADQCAKRMSMYNGYPRPIVIVPRYIAEPASNTTEA